MRDSQEQVEGARAPVEVDFPEDTDDWLAVVQQMQINLLIVD